MITTERAIEVIKNEAMCVSSDCDRDCANCRLVLDANEILEAFSLAIKLMSNHEPDKEK